MAKKRKVLIALLLTMVILLATACSGSKEVKQPAEVHVDSSVTVNDKPALTHSDNMTAEDTAQITVEKTVLYEADGVKVTATGYEDGWMGPEIKILVENDSARNVLVTSASVSANGYMMPTATLYTDVAAGKKANDTLSFMSSELEQSGIEVLAELQFYLQIQDPETWETTNTSDLLTLTTSAAPLEQKVDDSGDVLYDSNGIRIICKGLKQDIIWDGTVVFFMENNSGREISVYAEDVSVNGFMQDVGLWSDLRPGTKLIDGMSMIDLSDLEIENIDQIDNIEFSLRIVDADTWENIDCTDVLTLNFA